jgi:hypothetical protein
MSHKVAMPPQHRYRSEQEEALAQPSAGVLALLDQFASQYGQWHFLPPGKMRWTSSSPLQDAQLLAQQQDLQIFLIFRPSKQAKEIKEHRKEARKHSEGHMFPSQCYDEICSS